MLRGDGGDVFFIQHIQAPEQAARMAARGTELFGRPPEFVSEIGPVIGAHVGPGLLGVTALPGRIIGPVGAAAPRGTAGARRAAANGGGMATPTPTPPPPTPPPPLVSPGPL